MVRQTSESREFPSLGRKLDDRPSPISIPILIRALTDGSHLHSGHFLAGPRALTPLAPEARAVLGPLRNSQQVLKATEAYWLVSRGLGPGKDPIPKKRGVWRMTPITS